MAKRRKLEEASTPDEGSAVEPSSAAEPAAGRRKKNANSRIGRACDRCQHRKLACDPAPEGCPSCQKVGAWCTVTDPLTGTPTYRGEFEYLERQIAKQNRQLKELVKQLKDLGRDVHEYEDETEEDLRYKAWTEVKTSGDTRPWDRDEKQTSMSRRQLVHPLASGQLASRGPANGATKTEDAPQQPEGPSPEDPKMPDLRTGFAQPDQQKYVGVAVNNLSASTRGPKLNVLGWEIDLEGLTDGELSESSKPLSSDEPSFDRSYRSFLASIFGFNGRPEKAELPPRDETVGVVQQYLRLVHAFTPIFFAPDLIETTKRVFDDPGFEPSAAEKVCIHTTLAVMLLNGAIRNQPEAKADLHERSDRHFHFALSLYPQLLLGETLADVQALILIAVHTRYFPRPEVGWTAATWAFDRVVQLGYHRLSPVPQNASGKSFKTLEIQKRVFWSALQLLITGCGKLGRPMPIRLEDIEVEFPLPVPDEQLQEDGVDSSKGGQCNFLIGIEAQKVVPIYLELYSTMYATKRSPKEYTHFVSLGERRIKAWEEQWPDKFHSQPDSTDMFTRLCIHYLHFWAAEFRLTLHHPSLSLTKSFQFNESNLRSCLKASKDMVHTAKNIQELRSLDTTWYNCAVYLLAIQTTIYGHSQLKDELTTDKMKELKLDMRAWISIMGDIDSNLGTGRRLQKAVGEQIATGLKQLENKLKAKKEAKDSKAATPVIKQEKAEESQANGVEAASTTHIPADADQNGFGSDQSAQRVAYQMQNTFTSVPVTQQMSAYAQQAASYNFAQQPGSQFSNSSTGYSQMYPVDLTSDALQAGYGQQNTTPVTMGGVYESNAGAFPNSYGPDSDSWHQYTMSIPNGVAQQDYQPASALLQLGGRADPNLPQAASSLSDSFEGQALGAAAGMMWPLGVIDDSQNQAGPN